MRTLLRRIRGLVGIGIFSAVVWSAVGVAITAIISVVDSPSVDPGEGPLLAALVFGRAGFVAGVMAGVVLAIAERHRRLADLTLPRVALWGALGGLALPWLGAAPRPMMLILGVLGSGSAVAAVALARRAERIGPQAVEPRHDLPVETT
jgi:hypothetical protein